MKTRTHIVTATLFLALVSFASSLAKETKEEEAYQLPGYTVEGITLPVPIKIIPPRISISDLGQSAYFVFTVKENGTTSGIKNKGNAFNTSDLSASLAQAIRGWKFEPAFDKNGNRVAVKIGLRIKAVEKSKNNRKYMTISFGELELINAG